MHSPQTAADTAESPPSGQPRVWLVLGDKKGDNGQVHTLVEALGWQCELRHVKMLDRFEFGKPKVGPTLYHIDRDKSDALQAPWPDLIITIGLRPGNVALWIREQSGGRTKIVLLGKPSGMMKHFALIVTSSENHLPLTPNVLPITLPLMRVDQQAVTSGAEAWKERFEPLPRPLVGVMVGGPTGPYAFKRKVIGELIDVARRIRAQGGTPYFTTSRRTTPEAVKALRERLPEGSRFFEWSAQAGDNPYMGLLGSADGFIVTGDSISMMVEIARLGKPLAILSLPTSFLGSLDQLRRAFGVWLFAPVGGSLSDRSRQLLGRLVYRSKIITHTRDFRAFHRMLIDQGLAVSAGEDFRPPTGAVPDDVGLVVARIKQLMGCGR